MSKLLEFSGLAGAVLFLFGLVAFFFTESATEPYVLAHLILGVLFLGAYLWTHGHSLLGSFSRRRTRYGLHSGLYSLLLVGVLVLVNFLNGRYHHRWDLTEMKVFSLSPQTVKVLGQLKQDLEIYGFFERGENPRTGRKRTTPVPGGGWRHISSRIVAAVRAARPVTSLRPTSASVAMPAAAET